MKKMTMILVAALIAGLAVPAFAAVENVKVGGDITATGVYRNNFDFVDDQVLKDQAHFFQTSARIFVSADLTDNVSTMVRLINERAWQTGTTFNAIDVDLAYVKLADMFIPGFNLTVGRQELMIGEGMVVGSAYNANGYRLPSTGTLNIGATDLGLQKAFDSLKLDYTLPGMPMNFTGSVSKINESFGGAEAQDTNLYTLSMLWKPELFTLEPYAVALVTNGAPSAANNDQYTLGVRATGSLAGFGLKGEFAKQMGEVGPLDYSGWAGYVGADYTFASDMKPFLSLYNYFSGWDTVGTDIDAWVPVYPSNIASRVGKIAYPALFGGGEGILNPAVLPGTPSGLQSIKLGFNIQPVKKIAIGLDWFNLRANELPAGATVSKSLGNEIDLSVNYAYTDDVTVGLDLGYFLAGSFMEDVLAPTGFEENAWQALLSLKVGF